jgi:hypothetical protein
MWRETDSEAWEGFAAGLLYLNGGESGIRTPISLVESVTYSKRNPTLPVFPMAPVAHCSILLQMGKRPGVVFGAGNRKTDSETSL